MPAAKGKKAGRTAAASSKKKSVGKHKPTKAAKVSKSRTAKPTPKPRHAKPQAKKAVKAAKATRTTRAAAPRPAPPAKKAAPVAAKPAAPPARTPVAKPPAPPSRARKPRSRIETSATPSAAWFPQPSATRIPASFIPAPPRAEAPSNVAAPPAMADRVVRASDMTGVGTTYRVHPIRVDIEYSAGRMLLIPNPEELRIRSGEGVEWDFRYTGGADLMIEEIIIELPKGTPFTKTQFRAKKPTAPRHRVLTGAATVVASEFTAAYSVRCLNSFKSEVASGRARIVISPQA